MQQWIEAGEVLPALLDDRADDGLLPAPYGGGNCRRLAGSAPERTGEGWERLCTFLGVPVPAQPFPSENSRAEL
jgi:hypothetical protein